MRIARGAGMDDVPLPKFRLSLLGRFELTGPDGPVDLPSKKLAGLLAYLACTAPQAAAAREAGNPALGLAFRRPGAAEPAPGPVPAAPCAGRGCPDRRWRGNLPCARRDRLRCGPHGSVDRGGQPSFARHGRRPLQGTISWPMSTVTEEAWSDWLGGERQRLEKLALDAMDRHAEQELQSGNAESALKVANQAIAVNALREDAHRLVIRALAANGRRADALKHYDRLAELLKRELDVGPDPITQTLVAGLRKSLAVGAAEPPSEVTPPLPLPDRPSIAVLPFANMSGDPEQEYFADGVVEDILTALSPRHSPISAASTRRRRRSPRYCRIRPTHRWHARGSRASATTGCTNSMSTGCGKPDCRNSPTFCARRQQGVTRKSKT